MQSPPSVLLLALTLAYIVPTVAMFLPSQTPHARQGWIAIWQLFPVLMSVAMRAFSAAPVVPRISAEDCYKVLAALGTAVHAYTLAQGNLADIFWPGCPDHAETLAQAVADLLRWDVVLAGVAIIQWAGIEVWRELGGGLKNAAATAAWMVCGCLLLGPGGVVAGSMAWREGKLRKKQ